MNWHDLSLDEVFKKLETNKEGLTDEEAKRRQKEFGLNKLSAARGLSRLEIFLNQFKSPLIYILLIAVGICFILKEINDAIVILAAVFLNTLIGFVQEDKAEQSLKKLKSFIEYRAKVIRQGSKKEILSQELVPGDLIIIEVGDKVPADARLIETRNLEIIEAVLTGESSSSAKENVVLKTETTLADRENMIYLGTDVSRGRGLAIVVETGVKTELGRVASMVKETKEDLTPLQKKMHGLAKFLGIFVGILALFVFLLGVISGYGISEMFLISVAMAVAAIPESLVIGVTVSLALGMQRILKKKALIRKIIAAETLGSTTVICADKTGTLTEGKMMVNKIITQAGQDFLFKIFLLCHSAIIEKKKDEDYKIVGDTTEEALIRSALEAGLNLGETEKEWPRLDEIPFDSEKMYMATLHKSQISNQSTKQSYVLGRAHKDMCPGLKSQNLLFVKGAPEKIIELSSAIKKKDEKIIFNQTEKDQLEEEIENLNKNGFRTLAFAYKNIDKNKIEEKDIDQLIFLGLAALEDPIRKDVKETIKQCLIAGIRPIIVTGDHKLTAQKIAEEIEILTEGEKIIEGQELEKFDKQQLREAVKKCNVFARVEPKHKILIVDALQENGEVVAMTGDGINDAPALKSADIGIALGSGTEVAKETADLVLLDDNFRTIIDAVKEGRTIFDNIKKVVLYLLAGGFSEVILITGSLFLGLPLPVLPGQILWVNIIEDSLPAIALASEKSEKESMIRKEKGRREILDKETKTLILIIGFITNLVLLFLFWLLYKQTGNLGYSRTMIFVALGIDSLFLIFPCKNLRKTIFYYNPFDNKFLNLSFIFGFFMFFVAIYFAPIQKLLHLVPLSVIDWLILVGFGFLNLILIELGKPLFIIKKNERNKI